MTSHRLHKIRVVNIFNAAKWRPDAGERYAVISLINRGVNANRIPKLPGFVRRLIIRADDSTPQNDFESGERLWHALTPEQAGEILRFAIDIRDLADVLLVHCVAGKSRSPAVAIAIAEAFGIDDLSVAAHDSVPNPHVLQVMREAFGLM